MSSNDACFFACGGANVLLVAVAVLGVGGAPNESKSSKLAAPDIGGEN